MNNTADDPVVWRLEYFTLHKLASDAGIKVRHNNNVGDLQSVRLLLYNLIRKCIKSLLVDSVDGVAAGDTLSKAHGDLSYTLSIDAKFALGLNEILKGDDKDVVALQEFLASIRNDENQTVRIHLDKISNSITFNVGKNVLVYTDRYSYTNTPTPCIQEFFTQLVEFASHWQKIRTRLDEVYEECDLVKNVLSKSRKSYNKTDDPMVKFKKMIDARRKG